MTDRRSFVKSAAGRPSVSSDVFLHGSFMQPPAIGAIKGYYMRRGYAGTYVNLITSLPMRSLATRRSGGRGPAKSGFPRPRTTGWR